MINLILKLLALTFFSSYIVTSIIYNINISADIVLYNSIFQLLCLIIIFILIKNRKINEFTLADYITYTRLILIIILSSLIFFKSSVMGSYLLNFISLSLFIFLMDWLDGFIARKFNQVSDFGDFFDQEVDSFFLVILSLSIIIQYDGFHYILTIPLLRYFYITTQMYLIWMRRDLYKSRRRKLVCGLVVSALIISNIYLLPILLIELLLIISIFILCLSFFKDFVWLYRRRNDEVY